jgi:hypothetical protein
MDSVEKNYYYDLCIICSLEIFCMSLFLISWALICYKICLCDQIKEHFLT